MLNIYFTTINNVDFFEYFRDFGYILSDQRLEDLNKLKFIDDKKRSLLAELLVVYALNKDFGISINKISFTKNEFGKPILKNSNLHFNISHSNSYVVCAVSTKKVGIDIEYYGDCEEGLEDFFHEKEQYLFVDLSKECRQKKFFDLWTMKESYVKYLGVGLSCSLSSFEIAESEDGFVVNRVDKKQFNGKLKTLLIDDRYSGAICYDSEKIGDIKKIDFISFEDV